MTLFTAIIIFILGSAIGSFISVVIHRIKTKQKGILFSRSACPACKKKIKWQHLIPVFSWIYLGGKCAYCGKKISSHYLLLELITGLLFVTTFLKLNFITGTPSLINPTIISYQIDWKIFQEFFFYAVEFAFLVSIFFYDLLYKEIPDKLSLPAIAIAIIGGLIIGTPSGLSMLIGAGILFTFFSLQFFLSKGAWIGGGDLRMGILMGVLLGWEKGLLALMLAYILGGIFSLALLISKKVTRKTAIPFGPFLVIGTITALFFGESIINWYLNIVIL